jgi:hypothetical protein
MRKVTPIVTPSNVKKLFSFCTLIVWSARRMASKRDTRTREAGAGSGCGMREAGSGAESVILSEAKDLVTSG